MKTLNKKLWMIVLVVIAIVIRISWEKKQPPTTSFSYDTIEVDGVPYERFFVIENNKQTEVRRRDITPLSYQESSYTVVGYKADEIDTFWTGTNGIKTLNFKKQSMIKNSGNTLIGVSAGRSTGMAQDALIDINSIRELESHINNTIFVMTGDTSVYNK